MVRHLPRGSRGEQRESQPRAFLDTLEHASKGAAWRDEAIEGARLAFALFATAATREMTDHG
jgi:heme oxygenase